MASPTTWLFVYGEGLDAEHTPLSPGWLDALRKPLVAAAARRAAPRIQVYAHAPATSLLTGILREVCAAAKLPEWAPVAPDVAAVEKHARGAAAAGSSIRVLALNAINFDSPWRFLAEAGNTELAAIHPRTATGPSDCGLRGAYHLPCDAATLSAWLAPGSRLAPDRREQLGRAIHDAYRADQRARRRLEEGDPALAEWGDLPEDLKESNRAQADHIGTKLELIGLSLRSASEATGDVLTAAHIETLAELEHGRWNIERVRGGWRYAPVRDTANRRSPFLVAWEDLSDEARAYDRQAAAGIPAALATAGLCASAR